MKTIQFSIFLILLLISCGKHEDKNYQFEDISSLANNVIESINNQDIKKIHKIMLPMDEYGEKYYDLIPYSKSLNALPAEDYVNIIYYRTRGKGIFKNFSKYKGHSIELLEIGEPTKIEKYKKNIDFQIYIPLTLKLINNETKEERIVTTENILAEVIVDNGKYMLSLMKG